MIQLFQKISVELLKPVDYIKKRQMLLTDIGGKLFMDKHESKLPPMKIPGLIKEAQKKEYYIKRNI